MKAHILAPGKHRWWIAVIVVGFLLLFALALTDRAGAQIGGWTPVSVTDKQVVAAAKAAVKLQQQVSSEKIHLEATVAAEQQIVAGVNYHLTLRIKNAGGVQTVEAMIWMRLWLKGAERYTLISWYDAGQSAAFAATPCPKGATPVYVPRCHPVCVSGRCGRVCSGWTTYCRYPAKRTAGLAAPLPGIRDGCPLRRRWPGGTCTVSDSGVGWVSARCEGGYWFEREKTCRAFRPEQVITVTACIGTNLELVSAPGYRLRIR